MLATQEEKGLERTLRYHFHLFMVFICLVIVSNIIIKSLKMFQNFNRTFFKILRLYQVYRLVTLSQLLKTWSHWLGKGRSNFFMLGRNFLRSEAVICLTANYQEFCLWLCVNLLWLVRKKKKLPIPMVKFYLCKQF